MPLIPGLRILSGMVPAWLKWAVLGLAILGAWTFAAIQYGKQTREAEIAALKAYAETTRRIADAPPVDLDDAAAVARELCRISGLSDCDL